MYGRTRESYNILISDPKMGYTLTMMSLTMEAIIDTRRHDREAFRGMACYLLILNMLVIYRKLSF